MRACSSASLPDADSLLDSRTGIAQNILWQDAEMQRGRLARARLGERAATPTAGKTPALHLTSCEHCNPLVPSAREVGW